MTPGERALAEAARVETARVYGKTLSQHRRDHEQQHPAVAADDLDIHLDARRLGTSRAAVTRIRPRRTA